MLKGKTLYLKAKIREHSDCRYHAEVCHGAEGRPDTEQKERLLSQGLGLWGREGERGRRGGREEKRRVDIESQEEEEQTICNNDLTRALPAFERP